MNQAAKPWWNTNFRSPFNHLSRHLSEKKNRRPICDLERPCDYIGVWTHKLTPPDARPKGPKKYLLIRYLGRCWKAREWIWAIFVLFLNLKCSGIFGGTLRSLTFHWPTGGSVVKKNCTNGWSMGPTCSMGLEYLPACTINRSHYHTFKPSM